MCSDPTIVGFFRPFFPVKSVLMLSIFREILPRICGKPAIQAFRRPTATAQCRRHDFDPNISKHFNAVGRKRADVF